MEEAAEVWESPPKFIVVFQPWLGRKWPHFGIVALWDEVRDAMIISGVFDIETVGRRLVREGCEGLCARHEMNHPI